MMIANRVNSANICTIQFLLFSSKIYYVSIFFPFCTLRYSPEFCTALVQYAAG